MIARSGAEGVYRFLRWIVFFIIIVLPCAFLAVPAALALLLVLEKLGVPASCEAAVFILVFLTLCAVFFEIGRRSLLRTDAVMEEKPRSRLQSAGLWLVPGFLLWLFFFVLTWYYERDVFLLGLPAVLILAAAAGIVFPFRRHRNGEVFGCLGVIFAFLLFCIGAMLLGRTGRDVTYTGNSISDIPHLNKWQKEHYFPAGARDIKVSGSTMGFRWECRLSEKDFLDYAGKGWYSFRRVEKKGKDILSREPLPPYYEYVRRESDGGGLTLRYSVPEEKFRGFYAHH